MKKTKIYQETIKNPEGEILQTKWINYSVVNQEAYIKLIFKDMGYLAKCPGAELSVVLCCLKWTDFDTNEIVLSASRRHEICICGELKLNTVNVSIARLYKKKIFIKENKKTFLNPNLFFRGRDFNNETILRQVLEYRFGEPDKQ